MVDDPQDLHNALAASQRPVVFLSYPFHPADEWIKYSVPPLLEKFGCDVFSGDKEHGDEIQVAVTETIARSQAVIAFLTRAQRLADGQWVPSEWVLQEIGFARGKGIPVILVRDQGVHSQIGIMGNVRVIEFDGESETFWLFPRLRAAISNLLFQSRSQAGLAVCHMTNPGRKDRKDGRQWWDFWLWIDGSPSELDTIDEVIYEFPDDFSPVKEAGDPLKSFGDYAETDAPIQVTARIQFKSGRRMQVRHKISLTRPRITPFGPKAMLTPPVGTNPVVTDAAALRP